LLGHAIQRTAVNDEDAGPLESRRGG